MAKDAADRPPKGPQLSAAGRRARDSRAERLAAALRENLKRRKTQERGRAAERAGSDAPPGAPRGAKKGGGRPRGET